MPVVFGYKILEIKQNFIKFYGKIKLGCEIIMKFTFQTKIIRYFIFLCV